MSKLNRVGETGVSKSGLKMTIIAYRGCMDIDVRFDDSGYVSNNRTYGDFKKGEIKDYTVPYRKNKYIDDIPIKEKNNIYIKMAKNYWSRMIGRVYNGKDKDYLRGYKDVVISDDWIYFSKFYEWFNDNFRFDLYHKGISLEMDKDLLSGDKKIYSPETTVFIPKSVNTFMVKRQNNKHGLTGVSYEKKNAYKKYRARLIVKNKTKFLGFFNTPEEAHEAYVKAKILEVDKVKRYMLELGYEKSLVDKITFYTMEEK